MVSTISRYVGLAALAAISVAFAVSRCSPAVSTVPPAGEAGSDANGCQPTNAAPSCVSGWCRIPAGCGYVGSPDDEWGHPPKGEDVTSFTLTHSFWMMETEANHGHLLALGYPVRLMNRPDSAIDCADPACADQSLNYFEALMFANAVSRANGWEECYRVADCHNQLPDSGEEYPNCNTLEVTTTSLYECRGARLPTDVEWEYAARAGTTTSLYNGDATPQTDLGCHPDLKADEIAWYCANSDGGLVQHGGLKRGNPWGLRDMAGNVLEWVNEGYDTTWYHRMPAVDPWEIYRPERAMVVIRGGGVTSSAYNLRAANKLAGAPWGRAGFRLVRSIFPGDEAIPKFPAPPADGGP